ncbi:DASH complex subunit SPC19 [Phanerochaete sordida]|uniref:DASH complex subunit SPC19 n=1 Tax=Phanerochaete sordida TaxID=48140 RepID=A0A9P3G456_9APHY|nr:DASH complex subunit SPC19 [Phanerochaete sordida]
MDRPSRVSRLSVHPKYGPRQSVFVGNSGGYGSENDFVCSPFLRECVMALEDCCDEAHEAQEIIRQGTYDLSRVAKVLENERVFLLVDEGTVRKYKADVTDEIEPQINELLSRAEKGMNMLVKRENMLRTRLETQQTKPASRLAANTAGMNKLEARKIQILVRQREQLEEEMATLQAEVDAMQLAAMNKKKRP